MRRRLVLAAVGCLFAVPTLSAVPAFADTVPGAPTQVLAISGHANARVGWFGPADDGGSPITAYRIHVSSGPVYTFAPTQFARIVPSLANGVNYSFTVSAVNAVGEGPVSAASNVVRPRARTGQWANVAPMATARYQALAVRLNNGRVLVVGGTDTAGNPVTSAELYNPATNSWSSAGTSGGRFEATLTLLPNGQVLLAGGFNSAGTALATARLYNPTTNSWSTTGTMTYGRAHAAAVLLSNGKVLVAGGVHGTPSSYSITPWAELYTPSTGTWASTGSLAHGRQGLSLTRIDSGTRALAAGGSDDSTPSGAVKSAERYSVATGTWSATAPMQSFREFDDMCCKSSSPLADGRVLVAGGYGTDSPSETPHVLSSAEVYSSSGAGSWASASSMRVARQSGAPAVLLSDGRVLVVGGEDDYGALAANDLYNPTSNTWSRPDDLRAARSAPVAVRLADGRVLVAGGRTVTGTAQATAEIFTP